WRDGVGYESHSQEGYMFPTRYVVLVNAPGYLPDNEPTTHDTFEEARAQILRDLEMTWNTIMPDATDHTPFNDACGEVNGWDGSVPQYVMLAGLAHNLDIQR